MKTRNILKIDGSTDRFRPYAIAATSAVDNLEELYCVPSIALLESGDLVAIVGASGSFAGGYNQAAHQPHHSPFEELNSFSRVIADLHAVADILPFRFSNPMQEGELRALLDSQRQCYEKNLRRIAGCTEINARWVITDNASVGKELLPKIATDVRRSGSDYLRAKQRAAMRYRHGERELAAIIRSASSRTEVECIDIRTSQRSLKEIEQKLQLAGCGETKRDLDPVFADVMCVAGCELLVRREHASTSKQMLSEICFCDRAPSVISGPWTPYSFITSENAPITSAPFYAHASPEPVQNCAISADAAAGS